MVEYSTSDCANSNFFCKPMGFKEENVPDYENVKLYSSFGELGLEKNRLKFPKTIFFDEEFSHIYITEGRPAARISVFTNKGYFMTSFKHHNMKYPWGITKNKENIYVTDTHADSVFLFMQDGRSCKIKKVGKFYGSGENQFAYPKSIAVSKLGNVYIRVARGAGRPANLRAGPRAARGCGPSFIIGPRALRAEFYCCGPLARNRPAVGPHNTY